MKRVGTRITALVLILIVMLNFVAAPMPAGAQANTFTFAFDSMSFTHVSGATGPVGGAFTLQKFEAQNKQLKADGSLIFSLCVLGVDPKNCLATVEQQVALTVSLVTATCTQLHLETAPMDVTDPSLPGYTVHLSRLVMDFSVQPDSSTKLRQRLCALSQRLKANAQLWTLAPTLNQLLLEL